MVLKLLERVVARDPDEVLGVPGRARDKMVHGLMPRSEVARVDPRSHRFDALAFARQKQPLQVYAQRLVPISVPHDGRQPLEVGHEVLLRNFHSSGRHETISRSLAARSIF